MDNNEIDEYFALLAEVDTLREENEDLKEMVASTQHVMDYYHQDREIGAAASFYSWRTRQDPGLTVSQERIEKMAKVLGVETEVLIDANTKVLAAYPRYGVPAGHPDFVGQRVPRPNVGKVLRTFTEPKTLRVPPKVAKSGQRLFREHLRFVSTTMAAGGTKRGRGYEFRDSDHTNFAMANVTEALHDGDKKPKAAFNGRISKRRRSSGEGQGN